MEYITKKNKVRYYETDQMGFVHHSNYLKYFEMSEGAFFKNIDKWANKKLFSKTNKVWKPKFKII